MELYNIIIGNGKQMEIYTLVVFYLVEELISHKQFTEIDLLVQKLHVNIIDAVYEVAK